jgi:hypothetical protein
MQWRDMTATELATRPEAKLGGALLVIDIVAVLLCALVLVGVIVALNEFRAIGIRYGIAVAFITLWAGAFVIVTWFRLPPRPRWQAPASSSGSSIASLFQWPAATAGRSPSTWWQNSPWLLPSAAIWPPACGRTPIIAVAFPRPERL